MTQRPAGSSGDSLSTPVTSTVANGQASTQFTLGSAIGNYNITASCSVCTPTTVAFIATAVYVPVTVTTIPSGLNITVDKKTYPSPQTFKWTQGSTHAIFIPFPQGTSSDRHVFASWSNGGAQSQQYVVPATAQTLTAATTLEHFVNLTASPSGSGTLIGGGWYADGFPVTVAATPNPGWVFNNLTGSASGIYPWYKTTLTTALTITANFVARTANARQVYLTPSGTAGLGSGTRRDPYQTPTAHAFDAIMRTIADDTEIILASGVFQTFGSTAGGNCSGIGEPGWLPGKRWWIHGAGMTSTTIRLAQLCQVSTDPSFGGILISVIGAAYYQDNSDTTVSDLTVDGNSAAWGTHIYDWKQNIGGVSLNGSRCTIRNVRAINLYGWFYDAATGRYNYAEDFAFVISNPLNPSTGAYSMSYGNLIEGSEFSASGGDYIDGFQIFTGDGRQSPLPVNDETAAGLPGGVIRNNRCLNTAGVACFGGMGKGIVIDSNSATNARNAIRSDSGWVLDLHVSNNNFQINNTAVTLSGDLNVIFRRGVIYNNTFQAAWDSSPWMVFFKQNPDPSRGWTNAVEDMLVQRNTFAEAPAIPGPHYVPSALVLQGTQPNMPLRIQMVNNTLDPIHLQRGQNCPTEDEPICQTGLSTPVYSGSGNVTTTGIPVAKYNRQIP